MCLQFQNDLLTVAREHWDTETSVSCVSAMHSLKFCGAFPSKGTRSDGALPCWWQAAGGEPHPASLYQQQEKKNKHLPSPDEEKPRRWNSFECLFYLH